MQVIEILILLKTKLEKIGNFKQFKNLLQGDSFLFTKIKISITCNCFISTLFTIYVHFSTSFVQRFYEIINKFNKDILRQT